MSEKVTIEISEADMAELREWARHGERSVEALVEVALKQYMIAVREDHADLEERAKGPFYSLEEVEEYLAARRSGPRTEAAEQCVSPFRNVPERIWHVSGISI